MKLSDFIYTGSLKGNQNSKIMHILYRLGWLYSPSMLYASQEYRDWYFKKKKMKNL